MKWGCRPPETWKSPIIIDTGVMCMLVAVLIAKYSVSMDRLTGRFGTVWHRKVLVGCRHAAGWVVGSSTSDGSMKSKVREVQQTGGQTHCSLAALAAVVADEYKRPCDVPCFCFSMLVVVCREPMAWKATHTISRGATLWTHDECEEMPLNSGRAGLFCRVYCTVFPIRQ